MTLTVVVTGCRFLGLLSFQAVKRKSLAKRRKGRQLKIDAYGTMRYRLLSSYLLRDTVA
jgi:hypothetical protein